MSGTVRLRPVTPDDEAFLFSVYAATRVEELAALAWTEEERDAFIDQQFRAQYADYTRRFPGARHSVVLVDEEPAGRIWVHRNGEEMRLLDLALLPGRRGSGTGTVLVRDLQAEAAAAGLPLRHSVLETNAGAIRLYRRLGFEVVARTGMHLLMEWAEPGD